MIEENSVESLLVAKVVNSVIPLHYRWTREMLWHIDSRMQGRAQAIYLATLCKKIKIVLRGDWGHLLTLTLTSDDLESHIIVNVSSTSNIIPSFINIGRSRFFGKFWSHLARKLREIQKSGPRDFRYFGLVSETVGIFLIGWKMAEEIHFENRHFWKFKSHVTLTLTSDDLESHIVVNASSTLTNIIIWFVAAFSLIVDVQTYVWTDGHFYRVY